MALHQLVKVLISHIVTLLLNLLLEFVDLGHVVTFFSVLCLHLEVFECLVELLVLRPLLLLLERLDLDLLFEQPTFHVRHMVVGLQHFSQEVVGARDWHTRLDQELHSSHDVGAGGIVAGVENEND